MCVTAKGLYQTQATSSRRIVRKKKILHFVVDKRL
jgi:hypothetical protein